MLQLGVELLLAEDDGGGLRHRRRRIHPVHVVLVEAVELERAAARERGSTGVSRRGREGEAVVLCERELCIASEASSSVE